jgi:hypothetical protein
MSDVLDRASLSGASILRSFPSTDDPWDLSRSEVVSSCLNSRSAGATGGRQSGRKLFDLLEPLMFLSDDWNGEGSPAPSGPAVRLASQFLAPLLSLLPRPDVMASVDGGVLIEWESEDTDLLFEISPNGTVQAYVRMFDLEEEGPVSDHEDGIVRAFQALSSLRS